MRGSGSWAASHPCGAVVGGGVMRGSGSWAASHPCGHPLHAEVGKHVKEVYARLAHTDLGSFCVKSPNELNQTVSDFNETFHKCWLGTHSTKSQILGQSDQWCGSYGPPNFESFGKNGRGCQSLNPHIS